jgi:hypothetical protein
MPGHELRATRGPQPPDGIIQDLQGLLREELAGAAPESLATPADVRALLAKRFVPALQRAAPQMTLRTRAEVGRVLSPERVQRIPSHLPAESRQFAEYAEHTVAAVVEAVVRATRERTDAAGDDPADAGAGAIKAETLALHSETVRQFSQSAGLVHYVWTTQLDEIVRPGHAALEGSIQLWSERPMTDEAYERHAHPGEDRNCRCVAFPWDDGSESIEPVEPPPPRPAPEPLPEPAPAPKNPIEAEREAREARIAAAREQQRLARERSQQIAAQAPRGRVPEILEPRLSVVAEASKSNAPAETNDLVARALARARVYPEQLRAVGIGPARGFELRTSPISKDADGQYDPTLKVVQAGTPADLARGYLPKDDPNAWATAYWSRDPAQAAATVAVHEFGHHVHFELRNAARNAATPAVQRERFAQAEATIQRAYRQAVPGATSHEPNVFESRRLSREAAGDAPTRYARSDYQEFWSESFAAYNNDKSWLEQRRPIAFTMVRDVLRLIGLEE